VSHGPNLQNLATGGGILGMLGGGTSVIAAQILGPGSLLAEAGFWAGLAGVLAALYPWYKARLDNARAERAAAVARANLAGRMAVVEQKLTAALKLLVHYQEHFGIYRVWMKAVSEKTHEPLPEGFDQLRFEAEDVRELLSSQPPASPLNCPFAYGGHARCYGSDSPMPIGRADGDSERWPDAKN
jgi:hypothetical protein